MNTIATSIAYNVDCMDYLKTLPDNAFDLACVDPPYGAGFTEGGGCQGWFAKYHQDNLQKVQVERERERERAEEADTGRGRTANSRTEHGDMRSGGKWNRFGQRFDRYKTWGSFEDGRKKIIAWDVAPEQEYFEELFRVSRNQIIWGGNYFALPPTRCFLIWRKLTISETFSMAMAEYAWTSFSENAKVFEYAPQGRPGDDRFHPTQKPVALYRWIFQNYAKPGDKILDTHLGSGSSRIAAYDAGLDFVGCEIDPTYFALEEERFEKHTAQLNLFID